MALEFVFQLSCNTPTKWFSHKSLGRAAMRLSQPNVKPLSNTGSSKFPYASRRRLTRKVPSRPQFWHDVNICSSPASWSSRSVLGLKYDINLRTPYDQIDANDRSHSASRNPVRVDRKGAPRMAFGLSSLCDCLTSQWT